MHFKVAACGRLLQTQAAMHISFKLDEQANHSAGELLKIVNQKTGLHQEDFHLHLHPILMRSKPIHIDAIGMLT